MKINLLVLVHNLSKFEEPTRLCSSDNLVMLRNQLISQSCLYLIPFGDLINQAIKYSLILTSI
jgi:hypothetical protein